MPDRKTPREILSAAGKLDKDVIAVSYRGRTVDLHTPVEATAARADAHPRHAIPTASRSSATRPPTSWPTRSSASSRARKVTIGPAIDDGFYYDFDKPGGGFTEDDLRTIEQAMARGHQGGLALPPRGRHARRGQAHVRGDGRDLQGRDHRRHPARTKR